jgi:putative redox protein
MPSVSLALDWQGDLKFSNSAGSPSIQLDSNDPAVSSPPQALAYATMACMAMDVVHILQKGRHDVKAMKVAFEGQRAEDHPRRYIAMHIRFDITGNPPDEAVARAIELSHEKYCSVSNSIAKDIDFKTSFTVSR